MSSFQGHMEDGAVVLDEPVALPNGTVEPVEASREKPEAWGPMVADTDQPSTVPQMAQAWQAFTEPIRDEDTPLSVDPDDYPLF